MAIYVPQVWDDDNPLYTTTAARMLHIENGIAAVSTLIETTGLGPANLAANAVTTAKIADGAVTQAKLASPTHGVYRTIINITSNVLIDAAANTWILRDITSANAAPYNVVAGSLLPSGTYLSAADYTVTGLTPKLRVRGEVLTNGTQPAINFTFGLYPVTMSGAADTLTMTLGTVVSGSTALVASPAINATTPAVSSDFDVPANGFYVPVCVTSATLTNNAAVLFGYQLQLHHV